MDQMISFHRPVPPFFERTGMDMFRTFSSIVGSDGSRPWWTEMQGVIGALRYYRKGTERMGNHLDLAVETALLRKDLYPGIWIMEGLGYALAGNLERGLSTEAQLHQNLLEAHPGALVPLHVGISGRQTMHALTEPRAAGSRALIQVVEQLERLAAPGALGVALEGMGLVLRMEGPDFLEDLLAHVADNHPEYLAYLHHGIGRAYLFEFTWPVYREGDQHTALDLLIQETDDSTMLPHRLAGFAFPRVLANLKAPRVPAAYLRSLASREDVLVAYCQGMVRALLVWYLWAGRDAVLQGFLDYRGRDKRTNQIWQDLFAAPAREALTTLGPDLLEQRTVEDLFRFHQLP